VTALMTGRVIPVTDPGEDLGEQWWPVVGFEGWYAVSSLGHVRRIALAQARRAAPGGCCVLAATAPAARWSTSTVPGSTHPGRSPGWSRRRFVVLGPPDGS